MIKYIIAVFSVLALGATASVSAEPEKFLKIENAYAYATTSVQKNGAVFATIENLGIEHLSGKDLAIMSTQSPVAERAELHTHLMDDGIMMMRKVDRYDIADGERLVLEPTGNHIMLFGLKEPLKAGTSFPVTVFIGDGYSHGYGGVTFDVKVVNPGASE